MNVLISAYACEPLKGSEPGVGWNLSVAIARKHHVSVITRTKNKKSIEKYLTEHPIKNLEFIYYDLPWWGLRFKKMIGTQLYYLLWNLMLKGKLQQWMQTHHIDIVHHVTFNQYRTPSFGYLINKPFVIGPIGGAELIDSAFDSELESSTLKRENYRRSGKDFKLLKWLINRKKNKKTFVFSARENLTRLEKTIMSDNVKTYVLPSIGIDPKDFEIIGKQKMSANFNMVYAGRALDWKGLHTFIMALGKIKDVVPNAKATLIGINNDQEREKVNNWLEQNGLHKIVKLINFMPRQELLKQLTEADLFVYPAFRDSGSMAILEACALGCTSICFDVGGQDAFPDDVIIKVPVAHGDLNKTIELFSDKLRWAYEHKAQLISKGIEAKKFAYTEMVWSKKADFFDKIYKEIK